MVVAGTSQCNSCRSQINSVNTSAVFQFSLILLHCMLFSFPLLLSTDLRKMCFKYSHCLSDATGMPEQASGFWLVRTLTERVFVPKSTTSALIINKEFPLGIIFQSRCMYVNFILLLMSLMREILLGPSMFGECCDKQLDSLPVAAVRHINQLSA